MEASSNPSPSPCTPRGRWRAAARLRPGWPAALLGAAALASMSAAAWAADAAERGFIRKGMAEGEVVLRIGKPDHQAYVRNVKGEPEEKVWSYFPHARDAQTLTLITLKAGVVERVERKISR